MFFDIVNQMFGGSSQLPTADCRACGNLIVVHCSDNETELGSRRKLGGPAEHLIVVSENAFVG